MSPFGTVSMPGTFRKVKTKCFGPSKMPNDPLQAQRDDVMAFDSLLASLNSTAKIVASAVNMLASAPLPLSEELAKFYPQDVPGASTVARMCAQMKDFANKAGQASMHIEQIHQLIGELSKQNASVREAFKARDLAWQTQAHYNNKVDGLHDQVSRVSAASPKVGDKLHRNLAKKLDSAQALDLQMSQTIDLANRALAPKWQRTSDVLTKLCRYYIMVFEASGVLSAELREVVQELCGPKTAEAMVLRGQELANKARARISSTQFGRGVRDKLGVGDGGGAGGGAPAAAAAAAAAADGSGDAGGGSSGSFMRSGSGSGGGGGGGGGDDVEAGGGAKAAAAVQRRPYFVVLQCLLIFGLWAAGVVARPPEELGSWTEKKAGLDSFAAGLTDLRLAGPSCEDYWSQLWRLLTYQFTHDGVSQIAVVIALALVLGVPLEGMYGWWRMALIFNMGVLFGALSYVVLDAHSAIVGSFGGAYALVGMQISDLLLRWPTKKFRWTTLAFILFLVLNDVTCNFAVLPTSSVSGSIHLGGALAGLLMGVAASEEGDCKGQRKPKVVVASVLALSFVAYCVARTSLQEGGPLSLVEASAGEIGWCWVAKVFDARTQSDRWECVRCGNQACIGEWSQRENVTMASHHECAAQGYFYDGR